ncbi:MAG: alpha-L-fucosidase [Clostridia bacterium]|nr:alpha-L-fucosidase [Clostridia bacterium]
MTHENKLGLFIHWGIYAMTGLQEQALARFSLPREDYESLPARFNPVRFDADEWVLAAKDAGMKYICFTAKHHDGFCLFNTRLTCYNIMNTPFGRDVLLELSDACRRHGMLLSLYYSNPDWHHPAAYNPHSSHQWRAVNRDHSHFSKYLSFVRGQIRELLTQYGPIYTLFWDIPPGMHDPSMNEFVRSLQPGILINNRGFDEGDFSTPERETGENASLRPYPRMTEACNSVDMQSWGYRNHADFYSVRHLLSSIDQVMARGGSYLINIGPRPDGSLDPAQMERVRRIGDWYRRMDGCLECHESDPFDYQPVNAGPCIAVRKNGATYLHFYEGLIGTAVSLRHFPGKPASVRLMNTGLDLPFSVGVQPGYINSETGRAEHEYLHISSIPVDDLPAEPVVIEIRWD